MRRNFLLRASEEKSEIESNEESECWKTKNVRYVGTSLRANTTVCSLVMGAAASSKERAIAPSPSCARVTETVQWTKAAVTTARLAGSENVFAPE